MRELMVVALSVMPGLGLASTVVFDSGNTVPAKPYILGSQQVTQSKAEETFKTNADKLAKTMNPGYSATESIFPIQSTLSPGQVKARAMSLPYLSRPIFVIGDDKRSLDWAKSNEKRLKQIGAIGIVTNIETKSQFDKLKTQLDLPLTPASLDGFDKQYQLKHYPFLLSKQGVEQ